MLFVLTGSPVVALAQDDELAGSARGDAQGWGGTRAALPDDPLRIMGFLGVGGAVRLVRNLDPPFQQDFGAPPYLDIGGAVFFPGGDLRHGVGLALTTNLASDVSSGVPAGEQWVITPSYQVLLPLRRLVPDLTHDWLHVQGRVGLPLVLGSALGGGGGVDFSVGAELAAAVHFKPLAGFGLYFEVTAALYGGSNTTVHPMLGADVGLMFDYEVLP